MIEDKRDSLDRFYYAGPRFVEDLQKDLEDLPDCKKIHLMLFCSSIDSGKGSFQEYSYKYQIWDMTEKNNWKHRMKIEKKINELSDFLSNHEEE